MHNLTNIIDRNGHAPFTQCTIGVLHFMSRYHPIRPQVQHSFHIDHPIKNIILIAPSATVKQVGSHLLCYTIAMVHSLLMPLFLIPEFSVNTTQQLHTLESPEQCRSFNSLCSLLCRLALIMIVTQYSNTRVCWTELVSAYSGQSQNVSPAGEFCICIGFESKI